jgi:hypothetical protein
MPEVENVPLRLTAPVEDRKADAMERHADEAKALAQAQQKAADAMAAYTGLEMRPYRRAEFWWEAVRAVAPAAPDTDTALRAADEMCDGFEARFPEYTGTP